MFQPSNFREMELFLEEKVFRSMRLEMLAKARAVWKKKYSFIHYIQDAPDMRRFRIGFKQFMFDQPQYGGVADPVEDSSDDSISSVSLSSVSSESQ